MLTARQAHSEAPDLWRQVPFDGLICKRPDERALRGKVKDQP